MTAQRLSRNCEGLVKKSDALGVTYVSFQLLLFSCYLIYIKSFLKAI